MTINPNGGKPPKYNIVTYCRKCGHVRSDYNPPAPNSVCLICKHSFKRDAKLGGLVLDSYIPVPINVYEERYIKKS